MFTVGFTTDRDALAVTFGDRLTWRCLRAQQERQKGIHGSYWNKIGEETHYEAGFIHKTHGTTIRLSDSEIIPCVLQLQRTTTNVKEMSDFNSLQQKMKWLLLNTTRYSKFIIYSPCYRRPGEKHSKILLYAKGNESNLLAEVYSQLNPAKPRENSSRHEPESSLSTRFFRFWSLYTSAKLTC